MRMFHLLTHTHTDRRKMNQVTDREGEKDTCELSDSKQHSPKILWYSSQTAHGVFAALVLIDEFKPLANPAVESGVVTATVCLCKSLHCLTTSTCIWF